MYERQKKSEGDLIEKQNISLDEKFKKEQEAVAIRVTSEAEAIKVERSALAEKNAMLSKAEGIRAVGDAEADAIRAKLLAEAEGTQAKAEAMKLMGEASILEMYFKAMTEIAKNIAEPLSKVDTITMYGDGNNTKLMADVMGTMNQISDGLKESVGLDLKSVLAGFTAGKITGSEK